MAAPALTARVTPTGYKMPDGWQTLRAFSLAPAVNLWEMDVTVPGIDGGGPIETTTMLNAAYRTKDHKHLISFDEAASTCAYDPNVYVTILSSLVNQPGSITDHFPDGSTLTYYGYIDKFKPSGLKEGSFPEATVSIVVTNWDPVGRVEAGPVFVASEGT